MTRYLDITKTKGCIGFLPENGETLILCGVHIDSMPISVKEKEGALYAQFAQDNKIYFLFDDKIPEVDFYTVPQVYLAATDDEGGFIGSVGEAFDLYHSVPLIYISREKKFFLITKDSTKFLSLMPNWKQNLQPYDAITLYPDKEAAKKDYPIEDANQLPEYQKLRKLMSSHRTKRELFETYEESP